MTSPPSSNSKEIHKTNKKRSGRFGTRTFVCTGYPNCSMSFTRSEHLARHIRKHTGERPFECDYCARKFSRMDNLRQHKQTVHAYENFVISYPGKLFDMRVQEDLSAQPMTDFYGQSNNRRGLTATASEGRLRHEVIAPTQPMAAASKSDSILSLPNSGPNRRLHSELPLIPQGDQHEVQPLPSINTQHSRPNPFYTDKQPQVPPSTQQQRDIHNGNIQGFINSQPQLPAQSRAQALPTFADIGFPQTAPNSSDLSSPGVSENKNQPPFQQNNPSFHLKPLQFRPMNYRPNPILVPSSSTASPLPPHNNKSSPGNMPIAPLSYTSSSQTQSPTSFHSSPQQSSSNFASLSSRWPRKVDGMESWSSERSQPIPVSSSKNPPSTLSSSGSSSVGSTHTRFWLNSVLNNNDPIPEPGYRDENHSPSPTNTASSTSTLESTKCNLDSLLNE